MALKDIGLEVASTAVTSGKSYLVAGVVGLGVEEATGYPGVVWAAMLIGAFVFRKHPEGALSRAGVRHTLFRGVSAVAVAWAGTGALAEWLGLTSEAFMIAIAAFLAGTSEMIIEHIRHPEKLVALGQLSRRGRRRADDRIDGGFDGE